MNTFGKLFTLTDFGESHGPCIGGVIDGVPAGIPIDIDFIQHMLDRRRPGQSPLVTRRDEADRVRLLSGVFEGVSTGTPIGFVVENTQQQPADYDNMRNLYRPSHADFTYAAKYGHRDHRGGGRASARETIARVVAGAIALNVLQRMGVIIYAFTSSIGDISTSISPLDVTESMIESSPTRCPDSETAKLMASLISEVRDEGDTIGGIVTCVVRGLRPGIGSPVFGKLQALLASAMMSINAAKGFEYGMGFDGARRRGSEMIDIWDPDCDDSRGMHTRTNHSGGIQGGISNGEPIIMRVAFKPVATLMRDVPTVDTAGAPAMLHARGRHDPCVVPRAVPVVQAMAAITVLDAILEDNAYR